MTDTDSEPDTDEWPKEFTEYAHSDHRSEGSQAKANDHAETEAQDRAIRGMGNEVELRYRVHEDGTRTLLSCTDTSPRVRNGTIYAADETDE